MSATAYAVLWGRLAWHPAVEAWNGFSDGPVDCSYQQSNHKQSEHVWFLAGGKANRSCTVPFGVSLFFPLINVEWDNVGFPFPNPPSTLTLHQLIQNADATVDKPVELHASIDGLPVGNPQALLRYRAAFAPFSYTLPKTDNLYNFCGIPQCLDVPGVDPFAVAFANILLQKQILTPEELARKMEGSRLGRLATWLRSVQNVCADEDRGSTRG